MAVINSLPIPQLVNMFRENKTDEIWLDFDDAADVLYKL